MSDDKPALDEAVRIAAREFGENAVTLHDDPDAAVLAIATPVIVAELQRLVSLLADCVSPADLLRDRIDELNREQTQTPELP